MQGSARATLLAALAVMASAAACVFQPLAALAILVLGIGILLAAKGQLAFGLVFMGVLTCSCSGIQVGTVITLPDVFFIPALVFAIVRAINVRNSFTLPWWAIYPAVGILAWGLIGSLVVHPQTLKYMFQFAGFMFLVPMVVGLYADSTRRYRLLSAAFLASATVSAVLGVLDFTGISHLASELTNYQSLVFNRRATGLTNYSTQLGLMSDMALPFALWFGRTHRWVLICVPLLLGGVLASGSRGALIGVALAGALYIFVVGRDIAKRLIAEFAGLAFVLVIALLSGLSVGVTRLFTDPTTATSSDDARLERLSYALYQFSTEPLTGVGFGLQRAHNLYAELARSGGVVILGLFVAFAVASSVAGIKLRLKHPEVTAGLVAQLTWFLLAWQYNGLFERFLYVPIGLVLGMAFQAARGQTAEQTAAAVEPTVAPPDGQPPRSSRALDPAR